MKPPQEGNRAEKIAAVAGDWWRKRSRGLILSPDAVIEGHPELMPELGQQLRLLLRMNQATQRRQLAGEVHSPYPAVESTFTATEVPAQSDARPVDGHYPPWLALGAKLNQRYAICHRLGKGGMGTVYLAIDLKLNQVVAIKVFDPAIAGRHRDQVISEVALARQVTHINVCRIHDIELDHHPAFLSMEYVDGEDLDQTLQRIGRFVPERALQISMELCRGLAAAHDEGIIHRDIKPRNIMLDSTGLVRIMDFGLARLGHVDEADGIAGTLSHMAPEQLLGHGTSEQSDIFSLGFVLHEIFTGRMPEQEKDSVNGKGGRQWRRPSIWLPEIEPHVEVIILRCLQADPAARPQNVRSVLAGLENCQAVRLSPLLSASPSVSVEPLRWMAITALLGLTLCWLLTGFRPIEQVDFGLDSSASFTEKARSVLDQLGYVVNRQRARFADGFAYSNSFRNRPNEASESVCYWYRQAREPMTPEQLEFNRNQSTTRVRMSSPAWAKPGMLGVRLGADGLLSEFRYVPRSQDIARSIGKATPDVGEQLTILFQSAGWRLDEFESSLFDASIAIDAERGFGTMLPRMQYKPLAADLSVPVILVSSQDGIVTHFRVLDDLSSPNANDRLRSIFSQVLLLVVAIGSMVGLVMAKRNPISQQVDTHSAKVTALVVFVSLICSALFSMHYTFEFQSGLRTLEFGVLNAFAWAIVLWLLYMSMEPFVQRTHPEAVKDWILLTHGYFQDTSVALRILGGASLGMLAVPILGAAQAFLREVFALPPRYGIPPIELPAIQSGAGLFAVYCDSLANSVYFGFALVLFPMLINKIVNHYRTAVLLAWIINSIFYSCYFGNAIEPWWDWLLFSFYMSLWAALHLMVALRGGVLAAVSLIWFSSLAYFTPFTTFDRWYRGEALVATLLMAVVIIGYSIWCCRGSRPAIRAGRQM